MKLLRGVAALASLLSLPLATDAQTLVADYQVQGVLTSSVPSGIGPLIPIGGVTMPEYELDSVNGFNQMVLEIVTDTADPPVLSGVQSQTAPLVDPENYSIVLLGSFDLITTGILATKIFDFKNLSSDAGLYVNTSTGNLQFVDGSGVIIGFGVPGTNLTTDEYVQTALTRDSGTNLVSVYATDLLTSTTTLAFSFTDMTGLAIMGDATPTGDQFITLYKDDAGGVGGPTVDEGSQGNIARFRIYDGVLGADEIAALRYCNPGALHLGPARSGRRSAHPPRPPPQKCREHALVGAAYRRTGALFTVHCSPSLTLHRMPATTSRKSKATHARAATALEAIPNIGPSVAADLRSIGVKQPRQLIGRVAPALPETLSAHRQRQDPCVLDTFIAAVRFMEGAPARPWWRYTAERKKNFGSL